MKKTHVKPAARGAEGSRPEPEFLVYAELALVTLAGILWISLPQVGAWALILVLVPWVWRLVTSSRLAHTSGFEVPLALFLATAALGVWTAYDRAAAWSRFWPILGGVLVFYALVHARFVPVLRTWFMALVGVAAALYFLATHDWNTYPALLPVLTDLGRALQAPVPALPIPPANGNEVGGILAATLPFSAHLVLHAARCAGDLPAGGRTGRWLRLGLTVAILALSIFGLLMTTSRGAWVGLAVAGFLAVLWALARRLESRGVISPGPALLAVVVILATAAIAVEVLVPGGLGALPALLPGPETWVTRQEFHRRSLLLARDYGLLGGGLGTFKWLYSSYALLIHVGYIGHSHSLYLDIVVAQGLVGLLALAWMWACFVRAVWDRLLDQVGEDLPGFERANLGAATLSLVAILVHGLADTALYGGAGSLLLFAPLAFAAPTRSLGRKVRIGVLTASGVLFLLVLVSWRPLLSRFYSNLAAVRQARTELAVYHWPEWPVQDAVRRALDLSQPVADFERALALDPGNATANRRLGQIELSLGQYETALDHLTSAYTGESQSVTTRQLLGEALIVNGRLDEGRVLWQDVSNDVGQLSLRAAWYRYIGDEERATAIRRVMNTRSSGP